MLLAVATGNGNPPGPTGLAQFVNHNGSPASSRPWAALCQPYRMRAEIRAGELLKEMALREGERVPRSGAPPHFKVSLLPRRRQRTQSAHNTAGQDCS